MIYIHFTAFLTILLFTFCFVQTRQQNFSLSPNAILYLLGAALLLRLLFAFFSDGFGSDIACFAAWADRIFQVGPGGFYSPDVFTDYPPGLMYVLYLVGAARSAFAIPYYSGMHLLLLKLPAILCDLACGYLIYREADRRFEKTTALFLCLTYLLNPAVILNSSVWGQVDSVFTLMVVLMCLYLMKGKLFPAYIVFGIGILLKPQTLVFTPVLLVGIADHVFLKNFSLRKLFSNLFQGLVVILGMVLLCMPFGLEKVLVQYTDTLGSYPYAAVNAYNFWGFFGLNWVSQENTFLSVSYQSWGTLVILLIVAVTFFVGLRKKDETKYPLLGAFIILTMFVFSVRMHERYMYPGLVLLLFAYLYKPVKPAFFCYTAFTVLHLYNTANVLFYYDPSNYDRKAPLIVAVSGGMVLCICYFYFTIVHFYIRNGKEALPSAAVPSVRHAGVRRSLHKACAPEASEAGSVLKKADWLILLLITAVYSTFALYDLGIRQAPETTYELIQGESITLEFAEDASPSTLSYYIAPWHNRVFSVQVLDEASGAWIPGEDITLDRVFSWNDIALGGASGASGRYLRLTLQEGSASLLELTFTDAEGNVLLPVNAGNYAALFDEYDMHPARSTFRDSMYFDEIYHGRTAYEFLHGLQTYENTHPPLGKIFIALGIIMFGMNPFGWRIVGVLFGIAMVPMVYLFAKRLTKNTPASALACVMFSFDFMHFTQTRIATIDVYITFFVICMYYFMYRYSRMSFYDTPLKKTFVPLSACGICMGLGIACKWTGMYAGAGLAVIFFAVLYRRYREYLYAKAAPKERTENISHASILKSFVPCTKKTIFFCIIFFVAIPALFYLLSYLPFVDSGHPGLWSRMLQNQETMFSYHSTLESTHPYSSPWYQWPTMVRPIWYYSGIAGETLREGISAFGNPLVWWAGIPAFAYMLWLCIKKKDRTAALLTVGYLAQYLPWFFVTRVTFIYHYFPSVVFVVLMVIYSLMQWRNKLSKRGFLLLLTLYGAAVFALFLLFYPVLSGQSVEAAFVDRFLRWFDTWVLTAR